MKILLKLALMAAFLGALVKILLQKRPGDDKPSAGDSIADTNLVNSGAPELDQRDPQPQDWRGAQNVLE